MIVWQYTPYTAPLILASVLMFGVAVAVWQRRPGPGIVWAVMFMLSVTHWAIGYALELAIVDFQLKVLLANVQYLDISIIPTLWLAFTLEYTGRENLFTTRNIFLMLIEPLANLGIVWTDNTHHLFRTSITYDPAVFSTFIPGRGTLFWFHAGYSYVLLLIGAMLIVQALIRSPRLYREQAAALLVSVFAPWVTNALYLLRINPLGNFDSTVLAFGLTGITVSWSIARFRFFDIVPVARDRVLENIADAVMVLDAQGRIVDINPAACRAIGLSPGTEVIGKQAKQALSGIGDLIEKYRDVGETIAEFSTGKDSQQRYFQLRISTLHNRSGDVTGRLFVAHEITDLRQAAEQIRAQNETLAHTNRELVEAQKLAEEANRLKSEFLTTMSHELRTPLNAVIGFADLLLTGVAGDLPERQQEYVTRIMANGERLLALISDILDLSRIEAARLDLVIAPFAPADLLANVQAQMQSLADQKGLCFDTDLDSALPPKLLGDAQRLTQILVNLIGNAIRFTETGRVSVCLGRAEDSAWTIVVADTGIGIPPHALDYIFDEFRQVDGSLQRQQGGSGLGLTIVRRLALLMGGTVRVQSEINRGSTFTVQLPLRLPEAQVIEARNTE